MRRSRPIQTKYIPAPKTRPWYRHSLTLDLALALLVFVIGTVVGSIDVSRWNDRGGYYQTWFGPAVLTACGRGYIEPQQPIPQLTQFLAVSGTSFTDDVPDRFSCDDLPATLDEKPLNAMQQMHPYLLGTVALAWSLGGIAWSSLTPLFGVLYGSSLAAAFGIFRLGMNRIIAFVLTCGWMLSSVHLGSLPHLRDYSKAPFILTALLIMGVLVCRPLRKPAVFGLAALGGAVLGIGLGFRTDPLIVVPAFIITLLVFMPGRFSQTLALRLLGIVAFCVAFVVAAYPVFSRPQGGNTFHVVLLGFVSSWDNGLGVSTPLYEWGYIYKDAYITSLLSSYAYCVDGRTIPYRISTPEYDQIGLRYLLNIATTFPADMLTRAYASILRILDLPFSGMVNQIFIDPSVMPDVVKQSRMEAYYDLYWRIHKLYSQLAIQYLSGLGFVSAVIALLLLVRRSWRMAAFLLLVILYFGGYATLQFSERHYFHLAVLPLWVVGFVLQQAIVGIKRTLAFQRAGKVSVETLRGIHIWTPATRRMVVGLIGGALIVIVPLVALRMYQERGVRDLIGQYVYTELEWMTVTDIPAGPSSTLLQIGAIPEPIEPLTPPTEETIRTEYLVIDVDNQHGYMPLIFRYGTADTNPQLRRVWDWTRVVNLPESSSGPTGNPRTVKRYYFPILVGTRIPFAGIEVPTQYRSSIRGIYRIKDSCAFPLYLWLSLGTDWQTADLYQKLPSVEEDRVFTTSPSVPVAAAERRTSAHSLLTIPATYQDDVVKTTDNGMRVRGRPANASLVAYDAQTSRQGDYLVAKGFLYWGCVDIALQNAEHFALVTVSTPGRFTAIIPVPQDGDYAARLLASGSCLRNNNFRIDELSLGR